MFNMAEFINDHPSQLFLKEMQRVCLPLQQLGIDYFSHIRVDNENRLYANSTHPGYFRFYFEHGFHHDGLHSATVDPLQRYILWDKIERFGRAKELYQTVHTFDLAHMFTIVDHGINQRNYYNFAVHPSKNQIHDLYYGYTKLLEYFIEHYRQQELLNDKIARAYQMSCPIQKPQGQHVLNVNLSSQALQDFLESVRVRPRNIDISELPRRELQCALYLIEGMSAKEIAGALNISSRTVETYIARLKTRFECKNVIQLTRCLVESGLISACRESKEL